MLLGDQEDIQVRSEPPAHIGEQEVDGVERERPKAGGFRFRRHNHIQSVPTTRVMIVNGAPTWQ